MDEFKDLLATFVYSALKDSDINTNTNKDASTSIPTANQETSQSYTNTRYSERAPPVRTTEQHDYSNFITNHNDSDRYRSDYNYQRIAPESSRPQHKPSATPDTDSILNLIRREEEERQQAEVIR